MSAVEDLCNAANNTCNDEDDTSSSKSHCTPTASDDSKESGSAPMSAPSTGSVSPANLNQTTNSEFSTMLAALPSSLSSSPLAKVKSFLTFHIKICRHFPAIPWGFGNRVNELKSNGMVLLQKHSTFRSCLWQEEEEASLIEQVTSHHKASFAQVDQLSHACISMQNVHHFWH